MLIQRLSKLTMGLKSADIKNRKDKISVSLILFDHEMSALSVSPEAVIWLLSTSVKTTVLRNGYGFLVDSDFT